MSATAAFSRRSTPADLISSASASVTAVTSVRPASGTERSDPASVWLVATQLVRVEPVDCKAMRPTACRQSAQGVELAVLRGDDDLAGKLDGDGTPAAQVDERLSAP
jgi:hypothetical protein